MNKLYTKIIEHCKECPHYYPKQYSFGKGHCSCLDRTVDAWKIHKLCPLPNADNTSEKNEEKEWL